MHIHMFIGNLTKDCSDVRQTNSGHDVDNFSVAVNDRRKKTTAYIDCSLWGQQTSIAQYLKKGTKVFISGDFGTDEYNGNTRITCNVEQVELLGGRNRTSLDTDQSTDVDENTELDSLDDEIPF